MSKVTTREISFSPRAQDSIVLVGIQFIPEKLIQSRVCVLVHPWGYLGGSLTNTYRYAERLSKKHGVECLIFNSRGVGRSTGLSTFGCSAEIDDVLAACDWVREKLHRRIVIVGCSAGAAIAGSALDRMNEVDGYVGIGYPFGWLSSIVLGRHFDAVLVSPKPKLFIMGGKDGFTSVNQLDSMIQKMKQARYNIIPGVGHFAMESAEYSDITTDFIADFMHSLLKNNDE
jgi:alpha/beta superfamily hydrolase